MLDVFRFGWFAFRTFLGLVALVLTLYAALWLFVNVDSTLRGNADPDTALRLVKSYNAPAATQQRKAQPVSTAETKDCNAPDGIACARH